MALFQDEIVIFFYRQKALHHAAVRDRELIDERFVAYQKVLELASNSAEVDKFVVALQLADQLNDSEYGRRLMSAVPSVEITAGCNPNEDGCVPVMRLMIFSVPLIASIVFASSGGGRFSIME